jgi:hypothetical protein
LRQWDLGSKTAWGIRYDAKRALLVMADGSNQVGRGKDDPPGALLPASWVVRAAPLMQEVRIYNGTNLEVPELVETIAVDPTQCSTPHELSIDPITGDIYLCCVNAPHSNLAKYRRITN